MKFQMKIQTASIKKKKKGKTLIKKREKKNNSHRSKSILKIKTGTIRVIFLTPSVKSYNYYYFFQNTEDKHSKNTENKLKQEQPD